MGILDGEVEGEKRWMDGWKKKKTEVRKVIEVDKRGGSTAVLCGNKHMDIGGKRNE